MLGRIGSKHRRRDPTRGHSRAGRGGNFFGDIFDCIDASLAKLLLSDEDRFDHDLVRHGLAGELECRRTDRHGSDPGRIGRGGRHPGGRGSFDGDLRSFDFFYGRVERLLDHLSGRYLGDAETYVVSPGNRQRARLQPFARGLKDRVWYGGGSLRSYEWTGGKGLNLMIGSLTSGDVSDRFEEAQLGQLKAYRAALPAGCAPRVAAGRVILIDAMFLGRSP